MYDTILVPTDGSDAAGRALDHAFDLAARYESILHTMFVVDTRLYGEPALSSVELVVDEIEDQGTELLHDIEDRGEKAGIEVVTRCCHGVPHDEIIAYADQVGADLIVMGYSGRTHGNRIGSVTERVVRSADRPVLTA